MSTYGTLPLRRATPKPSQVIYGKGSDLSEGYINFPQHAENSMYVAAAAYGKKPSPPKAPPRPNAPPGPIDKLPEPLPPGFTKKFLAEPHTSLGISTKMSATLAVIVIITVTLTALAPFENGVISRQTLGSIEITVGFLWFAAIVIGVKNGEKDQSGYAIAILAVGPTSLAIAGVYARFF